MKQILLILSVCTLLSCKDDKDPAPIVTNPLIGTIWLAEDEVAELLYGGNREMGYEFLNETEVQYLKISGGNITDTEKGTYALDVDMVTINIPDRDDDHVLEINGSGMTSTIQKDMEGDYVTFTKQ